MAFAQYNRRKLSKETEAPYNVDRINRQIENARLRIQDAGFQPEEADKRNWIEKATNLPEGQNALFDILELINRPGQAVLNVIDKVPDEERTIGQALWRGFAGRDKVRGSELIGERLPSADAFTKTVLGTALEVGTDPLSLIPAGSIAKGVKAVAKPTGRGFAKFYKAVEPSAVKGVREEVVQPALQRGKEALGRAFVPDYKLGEDLYGRTDETLLKAKQEAENRIRFMTEESMKNVADAAKLAGGVEKGTDVGRIMEAPLKQFEDVKAYEYPGGIRIAENKTELLDSIAQAKSKIKEISSNVKTNDKEYGSAISQFANELEKTESDIRKLFFKMERQAGKKLDKESRANLREGMRELARIESQINNFGKNEDSLLRYYRKIIRDQHEGKFDLLKQLRQYSKSGLKGVSREDLPDRIKNMYNPNGLDIGKVAAELGYDDVNKMLRDIDDLKATPRKLDNATMDTLSRKELERSGALKDLEETKIALEQMRNTLRESLSNPPKPSALQAEENAFTAISENPRYLELEQQRISLKTQLDALRMESKANNVEKLQQIRDLEDEILGLKESIRNPVMIQKEIQRTQRELSADPAVQQAARQLVQSNDMIRQWALDNGIPVNELEGYMTHILAAEERSRRKNVQSLAIDRGNRGIGQPSKKVLESRKLMGSAEDINERLVKSERLKEGEIHTEPNAFFSTAIGQKRLIEYGNAVNFRRQALSDKNFAIPLEEFKASGAALPNNAVVIDTNNYKFINSDTAKELGLADEIGGEYIVTKSVKQALDRYQKLTTDEGINSFLKAWDTAQSFWKRGALFSVPYHFRNDIGAKFNNWVGGMNIADLTKYSAQADVEVYNAIIKGDESALFREFREQGLGSSGLSQVEFARRGEEPEKAIMRTIEKRSESGNTLGGRVKTELKSLKNPLNVFETSRDFGDFIDQTNRFALYKWAKEKGMTPEQAAKKVRTVQFDYTRLTPLEREVFTRVIPFYRWMRNNIPYQIRSFINDPRKYANINKLRLNAQEAVGIDEENVPDWMKESFALPVSGDGEGSGKFLGLNLPIGDLTKASDPLKMLIDSITPLAKLPAEVSLNRNFFYNKPIEKFEGQEKQFQVPGTDVNFGIDQKLAYVLEQLTGQVGRGLSGYLQRPEEIDQDTKFRTPSLGISSILKDFDADKAQYFQQAEQLRKLMDLIAYIEQQTGQRPRSVNEIR